MKKMDRNGPRPNRTGNGIEYLISLNIHTSITEIIKIGSVHTVYVRHTLW